jgi:S1-C subfamily serine protease
MPMLENFEGLEDMQVMMYGGNGIGNWDMNSSDSKKVVLGVITADTKEKEGAVINEVVKEGPASKIGLQKGDIIYKIDDTKIATSKELSDFIPTKKEGDKVKVYFTRAGKKMDATATLEMRKAIKEVRVMRNGFSNRGVEDMEMPNAGRDMRVYKYRNDAIENAIADMKNRQKDIVFKISGPKLGIKIQDTELETGVKVLDVEKESLSATAGLQKDDIIVAIADKAVKNTDEAREALNENRKKNSYSMKVKRNDKDVLLTINVPKKLKTANL